MEKIRVYELARILNMESKLVVEKLIRSGYSEVKNYMSTIQMDALPEMIADLFDNKENILDALELKAISNFHNLRLLLDVIVRVRMTKFSQKTMIDSGLIEKHQENNGVISHIQKDIYDIEPTLSPEEKEFFESYDSEENIRFLAGIERDEIIKHKKRYQNHCWNCFADIDSKYCKQHPGYGYYCNICGESLYGFYERGGWSKSQIRTLIQIHKNELEEI